MHSCLKLHALPWVFMFPKTTKPVHAFHIFFYLLTPLSYLPLTYSIPSTNVLSLGLLQNKILCWAMRHICVDSHPISNTLYDMLPKSIS